MPNSSRPHGSLYYSSQCSAIAPAVLIDDLEQNQKISFKHWATPGATRASAFLDQARTTCRRAEREIIAFQETGAEVNPEIIRYLNRLSDLCWLYGRYVETRAGVAD